MKQNNVYLVDAYMCAMTSMAQIVAIEGTLLSVFMQDNIFHPKGGGQPSDSGAIDGNPVIDVIARREGVRTEVFVVCHAAGTLKPGQMQVSCRLDKARRREVMALHTAGHLVSAAGQALGLSYSSCNHRPGQASVEFDMTGSIGIDKETIYAFIDDFVMDAVRDNHPVVIRTGSSGGREVEIGRLCSDGCGGTHVAHTAEIGSFEIRSVRLKGEKVRVGYRASYIGA